MRLRAIKCVFNQCIMQPAERERPGQPGHAGHSHFQHMSKLDLAWHNLRYIQSVCTDIALWRGKAKSNAAPGLVCFYEIPNWTMSSNRAHAERAIKTHSRPTRRGPQSVVARCETIDQAAGVCKLRVEDSHMNVFDHLQSNSMPKRAALKLASCPCSELWSRNKSFSLPPHEPYRPCLQD